jgi:hypothetical protein
MLAYPLVLLRTCRVTCEDLNRVEHSVEVMAESLYEAVARGLQSLHGNPWVGEIGEGLTTVTVEVREPVVQEKPDVKHCVRVQDFRRWLAERGNTPAQITARQRAREILGEAGEPSDHEKRRGWAEERNR